MLNHPLKRSAVKTTKSFIERKLDVNIYSSSTKKKKIEKKKRRGDIIDLKLNTGQQCHGGKVLRSPENRNKNDMRQKIKSIIKG